mgnify:CR=1 FL=1
MHKKNKSGKKRASLKNVAMRMKLSSGNEILVPVLSPLEGLAELAKTVWGEVFVAKNAEAFAKAKAEGRIRSWSPEMEAVEREIEHVVANLPGELKSVLLCLIVEEIYIREARALNESINREKGR